MRYLFYSFFGFVFLFTSCSSISKEEEANSFFAYLEKNNSQLSAYVRGSKKEDQKKIDDSFSHIDLVATELDKQQKGEGGVFYRNIKGVIEYLYSEYVLKKRTEPLTSLEKKLYSDIEKKLSGEGNNTGKFLILEVRKEAERRFDLRIKNQEYTDKIKDELKSFVDSYTQIILIDRQSNPENFQQFNMDHIAQFKTCFYLLMAEAIKK